MKKILISVICVVCVVIFLPMVSAEVWYTSIKPEAYYQFNTESYPDNATDIGKNNITLFQNQSGTTFTANFYSTGILNNALYSNESAAGTDDAFMMTFGTDESFFDFNGDSVTIAIWVRSTHGGSDQEILSKGDCGTTGWCFDTSGTSVRFRSGWFNINTGVNVQDGGWHRLVYTYNNVSDNSIFYVDGNNEANLALLAPTDTALQLQIGAINTVPDWENTQVDDFLFYRYEWDSDDIANDWNGGVGRELTNASGFFAIGDSHYTMSEFELIADTITVETAVPSDFQSAAFTLTYNNTNFTGTTTDTGELRNYSFTVLTPAVPSNTNITFFWSGLGINSSGDTVNIVGETNVQEVKNIAVDDCSVNTVLFMNLTTVDEGDQSFLAGGADNVTITIELSLGSDISTDAITFNQTFAFTNPAEICLSDSLGASTSYRLDAEIQYSSFDHVSEFYHFQNTSVMNSTLPIEVTLFDLATIDSQEFLIKFKDITFIPVPDALIHITRKYIGENVFKTVEIPKTDVSGQTIGHFVLSDAIYTLTVTKQGEVLATYEDVIAVCQDTSTGQCTINLNAFQSGTQPGDFTNLHNVTFTLTFNSVTSIFQSIFTSTDGSIRTMTMNVTDFADNTQICFNSLVSAAGTISCDVSGESNLTMNTKLYADGVFLGEIWATKTDTTPAQNFGSTGIILALIMYITLPMMLITERIGVIIFGILGLVFAGIIGIYTSGAILGVGSVILWFMIAGAIIIYKISRRKQ